MGGSSPLQAAARPFSAGTFCADDCGPSNIYMYTHGAQMIGLTPSDVPVPVEGHYARAALQALLLSILWGYYEYARPKAVAE
mmetsp:Transcript_712/g.2115  ORF Transcript_712/g.2115 Transcript_712/m.2115 type:complete len:82 (+) Transcript_712:586-831(+)